MWRISVDTGGTFTDCIAIGPDGAARSLKVLSSARLRVPVRRWLAPDSAEVVLGGIGDRIVACGMTGMRLGGADRGAGVRVSRAEGHRLWFDHPVSEPAPAAIELESDEPAPLLAARIATGTPRGSGFPPIDLRLATTRATNALLERRGAKCALLVTQGFADLLRIGDQRRPELFALSWRERDPLPARIDEIDERIDASGRVLRAMSVRELSDCAQRLRASGFDSVAVAFMHSWRNSEHEQRAAVVLRDHGIRHVTCSSDGDCAPGYLARMETAAAEAYLAPIMHDFLHAVAKPLDDSRISVMTSAGALRSISRFRAVDGLLSGPAAGAIGAWKSGACHGSPVLIGFDMGGTSTDVCRMCEGPVQVPVHEVGGVRITAPATAIETVAAGGGSVCAWRHGLPAVGPESAGADPGPAAYGSGGPLTLTDVNLLLGRIDPSSFAVPIDLTASRRAFESFLDQGRQVSGHGDSDDMLDGLIALADERMAAAIDRISLSQGFDPADAMLVAFGGAGGQHACAVAERLGMHAILLPAHASVLSAKGLLAARQARSLRSAVLRPLREIHSSLGRIVDEVSEKALAELEADGVSREKARIRTVFVQMRRSGQEDVMDIPWHAELDLEAAFESHHESVYGFRASADVAEVAAVWIMAESLGSEDEVSEAALSQSQEVGGSSGAGLTRRVRISGAWCDIPCVSAHLIDERNPVSGPALIACAQTTFVLTAAWSAVRTPGGDVLATRIEGDLTPPDRKESFEKRSDVVRQTLLAGRLEAIASEMGTRLARAAVSTNIRERLDFSCAVLDARGELLVSAPHVPVHLGALGLCVRAVREVHDPVRGEVMVVNHPAFGGSHLPDITVMMPVHTDSGVRVGFVAVRAHHAEIGGTHPGSMPPDGTCLADEGVVLPPQRLALDGVFDARAVEALLRGGAYPSRTPEENLADLAAQHAVVRSGAIEIARLAGAIGEEAFLDSCARLQDRAYEALRAALVSREGFNGTARTTLDDGSVICVQVHIRSGTASIDFSGTSPPHSGNLNATPAIVRAAVLYVLRLLTDAHLPLAEGLMRGIELHVPVSMLNPPLDPDPVRCPAVVGGNVETSQRIVEVLLRALGLAAASQGTMNNVLFGDECFGHYETIGGGSGAGPTFHGPSATHSHMTNTRITDPEVLEVRYPVRLEEFAVRTGSGGVGARRGGEGLIRTYRFLRPLSVSLLAQHRSTGPAGMNGGSDGSPGVHRLTRAEGGEVLLPGSAAFDARAGDCLSVWTPGGGGWGAAGGIND